MLSLYANNIPLEINGINFSLSLNSGLGEDSGSYSYKFSIPYTRHNAWVFGFPFKPSSLMVKENVDAKIVGNGVIVRTGKWSVKSSNGKFLTLSMFIDRGEFNINLHKVNLPKIFDLELEFDDILLHIKENINKSFPDVNFNWPCIYNPSFYGTKNTDDNFNPQYLEVLNDWEGGEIYTTTKNNNAISPQLFIGYMLRRIFEYSGFSLEEKIFEDPYFKTAMLYNNFALDKISPSLFSAETYNNNPIYTQYTVIWDENITDPGNHYNINTGKYLVDSEGNYQANIYIKHKETMLPTTALSVRMEFYYGQQLIDFFEQPCAFGSHPYFLINLVNTYHVLQSDIGESFWTRLFYLDKDNQPVECLIIEGKVSIQNIDAPDNNIFDNRLNLKNHVQDMPSKDFLTDFFSTANIIPFFDNKLKTATLVFIDDWIASNNHIDFSNGIVENSLNILYKEFSGITFKWNYQGPDNNLNNNSIDINQVVIKGSVLLFSQLPFNVNLGTIYFVISLNSFYIFSLFEPENEPSFYKWEIYSDNILDVSIDEGTDEYIINIPPIFMRNAVVYRNGVPSFRILPTVDSPGSSLGYGMKNDFPHRIMFYIGILEEAKDKYPIATTNAYSSEGIQVLPYTWNLQNVISNYFKNYIEWLRTRKEIEFDSKMSYSQLMKLKPEICGQINNTSFLLDSIQVNLDEEKKPYVSFKGYTK